MAVFIENIILWLFKKFKKLDNKYIQNFEIYNSENVRCLQQSIKPKKVQAWMDGWMGGWK